MFSATTKGFLSRQQHEPRRLPVSRAITGRSRGGPAVCSAVMLSKPRELSAVFTDDLLPSDGFAGE